MSKVDFLSLRYRVEPEHYESLCGIVDGKNDTPAYTTTDKNIRWNATIVNRDGYMFEFVPIDYNIIIYKSNGVDKEESCDGMLLVGEKRMIAFVELKDRRHGANSSAIKQLENTIRHFLSENVYTDFKIRRAYIANREFPHFNYNMKDEMEQFRKLHFVLYPEAKIII